MTTEVYHAPATRLPRRLNTPNDSLPGQARGLLAHAALLTSNAEGRRSWHEAALMLRQAAGLLDGAALLLAQDED